MTTTYARQRQLIGATAEWTANDLVIGSGELALERTSSGEVKIKIGDGASKFSALPYVTGSATGVSAAVSTELAKYLQLAGGTMTGDLQLQPQGAGVTVLPTSAVSRQWVENNVKGAFATIPEATAVTRTDVALSPGTVGYTALSSGGTAAEGNRIVKTNTQGFVDNSFIKAVYTGGPANAGAIVKLDASGYIPLSVMAQTVQGAMYFRGEHDPSAGVEYPLNPKQGDTWYISNLGQYKFLTGDCAGEIALHEDLLVFDGSIWHLVGKEYLLQLLAAYVSKTETVNKSAGLTDAGKVVKLSNGGLIDSSMLAAIKASSIEHIDHFASAAVSSGKIIATDANGLLSPTFLQTTNTFHGATDADKLVVASARGYVDSTLIENVNAFTGPADAGKLVALGVNGYIVSGLLNATQTSTGTGSAAKVVQLDANGRVSLTMLGGITAAQAVVAQTNVGAASGDKFIESRADGFLDTSFLHTTSTFTGTASSGYFVVANAKGYVDTTLIETVNAFTGPADAGKIAALGAGGYLVPGLLNAVQTSTGLPSAAKVVQLNSKGKLDTTMLDLPDVMSFKGSVDVSQPPPAGTHSRGEFFIASVDTAAPNAGWNVTPGQLVKKGDGFVYTGTEWDFLEAMAAVDLSKVLHTDGTTAMTAELTLVDATQNQSAVPLHQVNALITAASATQTTALNTAVATAKADAATDAAAKVAAAKTAADNAYVHVDGSKAMTGELTLIDATQAQSAVPLHQVNALISTASATQTTAINNAVAAAKADAATDAAAKVNAAKTAADAAYVHIDGSKAMTGPLSLPGAPTADVHAADKKYVDDQDKATTAAADAKYQTKVAMAGYLTTAAASTTYYTQAAAAAAAGTYQLKTDMSLYYTVAAADAKFQTKADAAAAIAGLGSTYETTAHAAATYLTKAAMGSYLTAADLSAYETTTHASATYLTKTDAAGLYETQVAAATHALKTDLDAAIARIAALEAKLAGVTRSGNDITFPGNVCSG